MKVRGDLSPSASMSLLWILLHKGHTLISALAPAVNHALRKHLMLSHFCGYWPCVSIRVGFALWDCGMWSISYWKGRLMGANRCLTTLWLNDPTGLCVNSPSLSLLCWLSLIISIGLLSLPPLCLSLSFAFLLVTMAATALVSCSSHGTLSLCALIICYATLALRGTSHWSPFLSPPVLICYASAIPSYTSHWSLSAELSFLLPSLSPLSLFTPLSMLFDLILSLSEICFSLQRATEVFFICDVFISREHKVRAASEEFVWGRQLQVLSIFLFRRNYLVSVRHTVYILPCQSVISITWMHQRAY